MITLNDRDQDLFYHADEATGRVEVAIIIPADWEKRSAHEGKLRPDKNCHLKTTSGAFEGSTSSGTRIVSLTCEEEKQPTAAANAGASHEIHFQKGKECWSYQGNDRSFVGKFLSWQNITVKAFFETDDGLKDAKVKVYNLTSDRLEIPVTEAGSYPTPEGGDATLEIDVQIDHPYKNIHFHICAITEKM